MFSKPPVTADLAGRTCVVTGATAGLGKLVAKNLARMGATVVLPCRTRARGQAAADEIARETGNAKLEVMDMDAARQDSIRAFAAEVKKKHPRIEVLVNNAGVWQAAREVSSDGIELTWATNVLAYHLLTSLLLDRLKESAPA